MQTALILGLAALGTMGLFLHIFGMGELFPGKTTRAAEPAPPAAVSAEPAGPAAPAEPSRAEVAPGDSNRTGVPAEPPRSAAAQPQAPAPVSGNPTVAVQLATGLRPVPLKSAPIGPVAAVAERTRDAIGNMPVPASAPEKPVPPVKPIEATRAAPAAMVIIPPLAPSEPPSTRQALPLQTVVVSGATTRIGTVSRPTNTPAKLTGSTTRPRNTDPNG